VENAPCTQSGPCPAVHGAVQVIGGQSFTWDCKQAYWSDAKVEKASDSLFECGKLCSERPDCHGANFWPDDAPAKRCILNINSGKTQDPESGNFGGALVRTNPPTGAPSTSVTPGTVPQSKTTEEEQRERDRAESESKCRAMGYGSKCSSCKLDVVNIGGKEYRNHCGTGIHLNEAYKIVPGVSSSWACAETHCSNDERCIGAGWDSANGNCVPHYPRTTVGRTTFPMLHFHLWWKVGKGEP
jgi:hypothetical protein